MNSRMFAIAGAAICAFVLNSPAGTYNYSFSGSGNWDAPSRWQENGHPETSADTVRIGSGTVIVAGDDLDILKTVGTVVLEQSDTVLVISNDNALALSTYIAGDGRVVKEGVGTLTVDAANKDSQKYPLSNPGGWDVQRGDLAIDNPGAWSTVRIAIPLAVHSPGRIVFSSSTLAASELQIRSLDGDGTLVNGSDVARQINFYTTPGTSKKCVFSGTAVGSFKYKCASSAVQYFSGSGCAIVHKAADLYGGFLGADEFPAAGINFRENATFEYTGNGGESPAKNNSFLNAAQVVTFSAGPNGGCTVKYGFINPDDKYTMNELVLSGDNAYPAVFDGSFNMKTTKDKTKNLACYLKKTGTGTWRFTAANKANRGTVAVEKGTLEYESMAEKGTSCSLGDASILHREYTGARDDEKAVGYAYLLGDGTLAAAGDDAVATMKYVGGGAVAVTGRTVAVKGSGRFSSASAALKWAGFTSAAPGANELILGGDAEKCIASAVTNGVGTLSVVKEGSGDWTVEGDFDFSGGVEAREGELKIDASKNFKWYKLILKENWRAATGAGDGSTIWISQFGLFDSEGRNWIENLVYNSAANGNVQNLKPGEVALGHTSFVYLNEQPVTYALTNAFNSANTCFGGCRSWNNTFSPSKNPLANPDAWVHIVVRPHETTNALVRYDIRQRSFSGSVTYEQTFARDVRSWSLEGSMDGVNWENLDTVISNANPTTGGEWRWIGTKRTSAHNAGEGLGPIAAETSRDVLRPSSVASVSAAAGATVRVNAPLAANAVRLDYALGGGTIDGFALAKNGTIDLVNVPDDIGRSMEFSLSLANVSGLENLAGYAVRINGKDRGWSARYLDGKLVVTAPGMYLFIR